MNIGQELIVCRDQLNKLQNDIINLKLTVQQLILMVQNVIGLLNKQH